MPSKAGRPPLPPWGNALAGATGAVIANAMVYPLDIVKTRLQVQVKHKGTGSTPLTINEAHYKSALDAIRKIAEDEGVEGLYSGIQGSLIGVASTNFAYFYWYSVVRTLYTSSQSIPASPNTATELSLGAVAGAVAQIFTIPVSVITTRQQTQPKSEKKGLIDTGKEVVNSDDGLSGLWRGLKASLLLVVNPAITYGVYQRLRDLFFFGKSRLQPWESFCSSTTANMLCQSWLIKILVLGATSKALATVVTQPLIVAKVGLQSRPPPARKGKPFNNFIEVMSYILEHEGPLALFKGIVPQIAKGILVQGVLMMIKERMEILFILIFTYLRRLKSEKLQKAAKLAASKATEVLPTDQTRRVLPYLPK
ncbi:ADP/ATP carrier protein [Lecanora helva]